MSKLLFLSLRNGEIGPDVAHAEYHDALRATGLSEVDMELRVIDSPDSELGLSLIQISEPTRPY